MVMMVMIMVMMMTEDDDEDDDDDPHSAASASVSLSRARKCVSSPPEREQLCNASFQELAQNMKNKNIRNQSAIHTKNLNA